MRAGALGRRNRAATAAAAGILAALAIVVPHSPAFAQPAVLHDETWNPARSEQRWAIELRFGPYRPDIDAEFAGAAGGGPHRRFFGDGRRLMTQVEVDFQVFQGFGTVAAGASFGYFRESARAFADAGGSTTGERSADRTSLTLVPVALLAVYRFDVLARRLGVPLVPYGKVGMNYTVWRITNGNGDVAGAGAGTPAGEGQGGTPGWQAAAGIALVLDWLDPGAARELDTEIGVNHTYLFGELARFDASGLGRDRVLRVGDTTWLCGLMFEF